LLLLREIHTLSDSWVDFDNFCQCQRKLSIFFRLFSTISMSIFLITAISIILFAGPYLRFRGPYADQATAGAFNYALRLYWLPKSGKNSPQVAPTRAQKYWLQISGIVLLLSGYKKLGQYSSDYLSFHAVGSSG
jgi:hypothetical protein